MMRETLHQFTHSNSHLAHSNTSRKLSPDRSEVLEEHVYLHWQPVIVGEFDGEPWADLSALVVWAMARRAEDVDCQACLEWMYS